MVIGNGMIANAFKEQYDNNNDIIIFASGVSNSKEQSQEKFEREFNLLASFIPLRKKIIYFSTVSVFDESLKDSKYIKHKLNIEKLIKERFKSYLILRLPNVVGETNNPNTFFNYFKNRIINNKPLQIQTNAIRYLIDMDDLIKILPFIISSKDNKTIDICFNNKMSVVDILCLFEDILQTSTKKSFTDDGRDYTVDNFYFMNVIEEIKFSVDEKYNEKLIKKYLKK